MLDKLRSFNNEFSSWATSQPDEWKPRTIRSINRRHEIYPPGLSWFSGRIDVYLDRKYHIMAVCSYINSTVYVSAVWNAYRKNHLLILNNIIRCSRRLEKGNSCHEEKFQFDEILGDLLASVPFHLVSNLTSFAEQVDGGLEPTIIPGRSIGGLIIMHPLYVISHLSVVHPRIHAQMRDCLAWIGTHMGIGEATILSSVRKPKLQNIRD